MTNKPLSRRSFLKRSVGAAGLMLGATVTPFGYKLLNASDQKEDSTSVFEPTVWFRIAPDNSIMISIPNSEMGQGVRTALSMIIADELEAEWKSIRIVQTGASDSFKNPIFSSQITVGSASVRGFYEPLRKVGAAGRAMLLTAAAQSWQVPERECEALLGTVRHKESGRSLTYGQLCLKASSLKMPENPPLKGEAEFRYMGKPMPRVDIPEKVAGTAIYGLDVQIPGMLYAVIARPSAYGARALSYDLGTAEAVKGVRKIVPSPNGIAVCAESLDAAWKGREALHVKWSEGSHPGLDTDSIEKEFLESLGKPGAVGVKTGDATKALNEASKKVEAVYFLPFVAHATMEPMNATAHVEKDCCDIWVPTQAQTATQLAAARMLDVVPEKVSVHTTLLGCGLGRRGRVDFVVDAVAASKAVGRPVKVVWSREEDMRYDYYRAATCHRIVAGLDSQNRLIGWSQKVACSSILRYLNPAGLKNGIDMYSLGGIVDYPDSPHANQTAYDIPNFYVEQILSNLPVPVAPWRSVQNAPNAFVMECFMDELAHAAGRDPLEFRLSLLQKNLRARRVLETVAEKAGWGKPMPKGRGRGIAQHSCFGSSVAQVAEVSVNGSNGSVKVDRVVVAVDCGPVVNPDPLEAQMEGGVIIGLSTALKEQVEFAFGGAKTANFDDYNVLRMSETPEIEVHIVKSNEKIGGIGEPGVPPAAPAVANAIFAAVGVRLRRLPMTPDRVMAAMKDR